MVRLTKIMLGIYLFVVFIIAIALYMPFYIIFTMSIWMANGINYLLKGLVFFCPNTNSIEILHQPFEIRRSEDYLPWTEKDFDNLYDED